MSIWVTSKYSFVSKWELHPNVMSCYHHFSFQVVTPSNTTNQCPSLGDCIQVLYNLPFHCHPLHKNICTDRHYDLACHIPNSISKSSWCFLFDFLLWNVNAVQPCKSCYTPWTAYNGHCTTHIIFWYNSKKCPIQIYIAFLSYTAYVSDFYI